MTDYLDILACQVDVPAVRTAGERDAHVSRLCEQVKVKLQSQRVGLVLLPELVSIDYSRASFDRLAELSEPLDGASFLQWQNISKQFSTYVSFGIARRDETGEFFVSSVVIGPDGSLLGYYDKIHLAQFGASMEKDYFSGGESLSVFSIDGFRLGTLICADIRFPEACRTLVVDYHIDVLLHPSAYSRDATFFSWHTFVQARAIENQIYVVSLNRAGEEYGRSIFVPPWVDESHQPMVFSDVSEEFKHIRISRSDLEEARELYPFLKDRKNNYQ